METKKIFFADEYIKEIYLYVWNIYTATTNYKN